MFQHRFYLIYNLQEISWQLQWHPRLKVLFQTKSTSHFCWFLLAALFAPMVFVVSQPVGACIAGKTSITEISNTSTMRWKETALLVNPLPHKTHISEAPIHLPCYVKKARSQYIRIGRGNDDFCIIFIFDGMINVK